MNGARIKTNHNTKIFKINYSNFVEPTETNYILDQLKNVHLNKIKEAVNKFSK